MTDFENSRKTGQKPAYELFSAIKSRHKQDHSILLHQVALKKRSERARAGYFIKSRRHESCCVTVTRFAIGLPASVLSLVASIIGLVATIVKSMMQTIAMKSNSKDEQDGQKTRHAFSRVPLASQKEPELSFGVDEVRSSKLQQGKRSEDDPTAYKVKQVAFLDLPGQAPIISMLGANDCIYFFFLDGCSATRLKPVLIRARHYKARGILWLTYPRINCQSRNEEGQAVFLAVYGETGATVYRLPLNDLLQPAEDQKGQNGIDSKKDYMWFTLGSPIRSLSEDSQGGRFITIMTDKGVFLLDFNLLQAKLSWLEKCPPQQRYTFIKQNFECLTSPVLWSADECRWIESTMLEPSLTSTLRFEAEKTVLCGDDLIIGYSQANTAADSSQYYEIIVYNTRSGDKTAISFNLGKLGAVPAKLTSVLPITAPGSRLDSPTFILHFQHESFGPLLKTKEGHLEAGNLFRIDRYAPRLFAHLGQSLEREEECLDQIGLFGLVQDHLMDSVKGIASSFSSHPPLKKFKPLHEPECSVVVSGKEGLEGYRIEKLQPHPRDGSVIGLASRADTGELTAFFGRLHDKVEEIQIIPYSDGLQLEDLGPSFDLLVFPQGAQTWSNHQEELFALEKRNGLLYCLN